MEHRKKAQTNLGDKSLDAVKFVNSRESTTPKELAAHLGIDNKIAGNLLADLASSDHIQKKHRGTYVGIGSERGEKDETAGTGPAISSPSPHSPHLDQQAVTLNRTSETDRQTVIADKQAAIGKGATISNRHPTQRPRPVAIYIPQRFSLRNWQTGSESPAHARNMTPGQSRISLPHFPLPPTPTKTEGMHQMSESIRPIDQSRACRIALGTL